MRTAVVLLLVLLAVAAYSACQVFGGFESFKPHPCNVLASSKLDDRGNGTLVLSKQADGTCYWIDRTEVTVQQYAQFVASRPGAASFAKEPGCAWKTTPSDPANAATDSCRARTSAEDDPFARSKPIRCVDWCDASAYCTWVGGYLCGSSANGSFVATNGLTDQWGFACSANGATYPTGTTFVLGQCNMGLSDAGLCANYLHESCGPVRVDTPTECTSPCGAVHMVGNVSEWVAFCGALDAGADAMCQTRGGSFAGDPSDPDETCYNPGSAPQRQPDPTIGFRCCADLKQPERGSIGLP